MEENIKNKLPQQSEYWDLITSTLSSYEVKDIADDGTVTKRLVNDDYFFVNDVWNIDNIGQIPNFQEQYMKYKGTNQNIKFQTENHSLALELKFVFYHKLFSDEVSLASLFTAYAPKSNKLIQFLDKKHPRLHSLLDLDIERAEKDWIWWLNDTGVKTITKFINLKYGEYENKTNTANFFRQVYEKLFNLTDTRIEWEKDRWDVRVLNEKYGLIYNLSRTDYHLNFTKIENVVFRNYFKKYIKTRLLGGKNFSWSTALNYLKVVPLFLNFISKFEPDWNDLKGLTRNHIEKYLEHLHRHAKNIVRKGSNPKQHVLDNVTRVYTFLQDTQRFEYIIAPEKSSSKLLYSEDYPTVDKKSDDDIDYIPDYVLEQLFENLNDLHPDIQPIVWVSFKCGMRISDTLGLTHDSLIRLNGKYSIQTDIEKTYVKGHKIPIDDQLADILAVLIHKSKESSNDDNNPEKYIFVRYSGSRKGKPFSQHWVQKQLNDLAIKKNIKDEIGNVFHFKAHQFRHTYAVKMLNGGADILTVQELLAHASPEMTMRYARLLDDTKRKEFEKVVKQGVFSFDLNGEMHQVAESEDIPEDILEMMWKDEKLNALDNPYGTCRARVNGNCPLAAEPPCLTANDGKPCFDLAVGMTSFDAKKYELLIDTTTKWIKASKEYGREDMVKANEKNLERYQNIYETIKNGNVIFGRFDRMKRQLEGKKRKGGSRG
ncbi:MULTISPECIES: tyrosine-type recombinase/integrase [unclassified Bacillus (in: firmicutes)]|uniref:tyrosine-type recombinase/integrase n=1 Tax=unclassified Bacillus (in: firmicutes) TaxID=185979 RepID=UPI001BECEC21|nr:MULTISPECIES: tyrosine-type recombinase/integrase [unclassified Bacillus (in: firmicutes)]MBT2616302.1 tyrosine-type recombinase/integrase [Bacillus sp. ISL-78]MBT2632304.1 tyrosine-type recombinase/integrase [Bacillus sp. ISL-101]